MGTSLDTLLFLNEYGFIRRLIVKTHVLLHHVVQGGANVDLLPLLFGKNQSWMISFPSSLVKGCSTIRDKKLG